MTRVTVAILTILFWCTVGSNSTFLDKLFSGYDTSGGYYYQGNGGYYPTRSGYGRHYGGHTEGGGDRYKSICRIHSVDSLAYPGRVGNPVCP